MTCDRISALLDRAGFPLLVVANPDLHKIYPVIHETLDDCVEAIVRDRRRDDVDTIERLAAALENALNERDQLMRDLKNVSTRYNSCECCVHDPYHSLECYKCMTENRWTWRGIPDKEG